MRQKLNVSFLEKATHTKDAQIEKESNQSVLTNYKGRPAYKKNRCSVNMWWTTKRNKELELCLKENNFDIVTPNETFLKKIDFKIQGYNTIKIILQLVPEVELPSS